ncbi:unnamed protein product, partial [marine sediment metagenome]
IAKWDGQEWSDLDWGVNSVVRALTVFDDGTGPALYVGGEFTHAGQSPAPAIAKWDGMTWSALGSGMGGVSRPRVSALSVFDDGTRPALYAGGQFQTAGGIDASDIARWDGSVWSAVDSGIGGHVMALTSFQSGSTPLLYVGGEFHHVGDRAAVHIAQWDGTTFSSLGGGNGLSNAIHDMTVFDDGNGPALYAGGRFYTAGRVVAPFIARWDGLSWSPLGTGMDEITRALGVFDDGGGPALYAGGAFTTAGGIPANRIAKWDGESWSALGSG